MNGLKLRWNYGIRVPEGVQKPPKNGSISRGLIPGCDILRSNDTTHKVSVRWLNGAYM